MNSTPATYLEILFSTLRALAVSVDKNSYATSCVSPAMYSLVQRSYAQLGVGIWGASFQDRCLHLHNQSSGERFCPLDWSFPTDWTSMVLHLLDSKFCTGGNYCNGHLQLQCCEHCIRPVAGLLITVPRIPTNAFLLWGVQTIGAAACVNTPSNCYGAVNTTGREEAETGGE